MAWYIQRHNITNSTPYCISLFLSLSVCLSVCLSQILQYRYHRMTSFDIIVQSLSPPFYSKYIKIKLNHNHLNRAKLLPQQHTQLILCSTKTIFMYLYYQIWLLFIWLPHPKSCDVQISHTTKTTKIHHYILFSHWGSSLGSTQS